MRFFGILLALLLARVATFTFVMAQTAPSIISNADPGLNFYPQYCPGLLLDNCTGGWSNTVLGNGATVKASNGPASPNDPLPSVNFTFLGSALELHTLQDPHGAVMLIQLDGHAWQFNSTLDSITQPPVTILNVTGLDPNVTHTLTVSWSNSSSSAGGQILYFDSLVIAGYGIPPNTSESNTTPPTSFSTSLPMSTLTAPADTASGLPLTQSNDQSSTVKRSWPPAYIATVVLIAALFAILVAISIFLFCRNRRLRSQLRVTPWSTGGTETPIPSDQFAPKRRHQIFSDFGLHRASGDNGELHVSPFRVSIYADIRRESRAPEDVENDGASQVPSSNRSSFTVPPPPRSHFSSSEPFRVLESQWDRTELPSSPTLTSTTDSPRYSSISGSTSTSTLQSGWQSKDLYTWDRGKITSPAHRTKGSVDCLMLNDALSFEHRNSFQIYGTPPPAYAFQTQSI
ncbi:hypothetical protein BD410DRAFT_838453 [Rickenella mellea]|uniref:Fibronectin type-III domain-containing protein n=1 Tax=Rickenella mellea TaxID=50990 RepID=A0A4Y7Q9L7_9AGAM|nr:hypothetical protein BD410DRAFT_838453 [Rickenella mellea]